MLTSSITAIMLAATLIVMSMAAFPTAAKAQTDRTFESEEGRYRLQIPQGWVIQDDDITQEPTFETIALLCLENEALPTIGGGYNCEGAALTDLISINRWSDLQSRPEFQNESSSIITTNDLVALWIQFLQSEYNSSQIKIENTTDIDEFTKIVGMTYEYLERAGTFLPFDDYIVDARSSGMYVLSQDRNTGYNIINNVANDNQAQHSPAVQEVFNSFESVE